MKSFMYTYAISTSHTKEKVNVFSVKDLARSICDLHNGIQSRDELVLSGTF
jgi:hypothetical protein